MLRLCRFTSRSTTSSHHNMAKSLVVVKPLRRVKLDDFCNERQFTINLVETATMPGDPARYVAFLTYGADQVQVFPTTICERYGTRRVINETAYGADMTSALMSLLRLINGKSFSILTKNSKPPNQTYEQVAPVTCFYPISDVYAANGGEYVIQSDTNI